TFQFGVVYPQPCQVGISHGSEQTLQFVVHSSRSPRFATFCSGFPGRKRGGRRRGNVMSKAIALSTVIYCCPLLIFSSPSYAASLALRCEGTVIDETKERLLFSIMIDPERLVVSDLGYGPGAQTIEFSSLNIIAKQELPTWTETISIDRVTG